MKPAALAVAAAAMMGAPAEATLGVDVSQPVSAAAAKCMVQNGKSFAVVRGWCSFGGPDSNAPATIANMWAGGMAHVDTYMFPCRAKDAATQMDDFVAELASKHVRYGMIWLDIETNPSPGCGWGVEDAASMTPEALNVTASANCGYIGSLISAAEAKGVNVGVYASKYMWGLVAGSDCTVGASRPLWYAHYDGVPGFGDFTPFGGWSKPAVKQYSGTGSICGVGVDLNFY